MWRTCNYSHVRRALNAVTLYNPAIPWRKGIFWDLLAQEFPKLAGPQARPLKPFTNKVPTFHSGRVRSSRHGLGPRSLYFVCKIWYSNPLVIQRTQRSKVVKQSFKANRKRKGRNRVTSFSVTESQSFPETWCLTMKTPGVGILLWEAGAKLFGGRGPVPYSFGHSPQE